MIVRIGLLIFLICALACGFAVMLGRGLPNHQIAVIAGEGGVNCGANIKPFNIVQIDVQHNLRCSMAGVDGNVTLGGWSPDGTQIALEVDGTVYVADASLSPVIQFERAGSPAWSVNGDLVFVSHEAAYREIHVWSGGNIRNVSPSDGDNRLPVWSHDGSRIVHLCGDTEICIVDADGQNSRRLTSDGFIKIQLSWSPDDREIIFQRSDPNKLSQVYAIGVDVANERRIDSEQRLLIVPTYSPDGRRVAFLEAASLTAAAIYLQDTATGHTYQLLGEQYYGITKLAWSPDGQTLAFVLNYNTYLVDADGGNLRLLCYDCDNPIWNPPPFS
jgi:Tol biopolymer transport system component